VPSLAFVPPCSPTTASKPPTGERWTHEVKWDGYRFQVLKIGRGVRLFSRNGVDWTERLPAMAAAFASLPARMAQIDGELCLCDADGRPDFRALMRAARQRPADETRLSFHAFDLLHLNAADLKPKSLAERRRRLVELVHGLDEELAANYFKATQADAKLRRDAAKGIKGQVHANKTHNAIGAGVRETIKGFGGQMPEDEPALDHIKQAEKRLKASKPKGLL
jgi:bifunctional non-homologous end joining protein LigD